MTSSEIGEAVEEVAVAVAEHHLLAVPERVVVAAPVVDGRVEMQALVVDRIAVVDVGEEIERRAEPVVRLVRLDVGERRRAFGAHRHCRAASP